MCYRPPWWLSNKEAACQCWKPVLGREDLLEKEMGTHSSILAWGIPWTEEPSATVYGVAKELDTTERLNNNNRMCYATVCATRHDFSKEGPREFFGRHTLAGQYVIATRSGKQTHSEGQCR